MNTGISAKRVNAFMAINSERYYQDDLPPSRTDGAARTVADYITMLQHYQTQLVAAWVTNPGDEQALNVMQKIAGIAVHCMEDHGAPFREGYNQFGRITGSAIG